MNLIISCLSSLPDRSEALRTWVASARRLRIRLAAAIPSSVTRIVLAHVLFAMALGAGPAQAQGPLEQDWTLLPQRSTLNLQTVHDRTVVEVHKLTGIEGTVSAGGDARLRLDLTAVDSTNALRDARLRFLLFETFQFPDAQITARIDKARLQGLTGTQRVSYPLDVTVTLRGVTLAMQIPVAVRRLDETTVAVSTVKPVFVTADSVGLGRNLAKLVAVMGGMAITPAASITFDLVFAAAASPAPAAAAVAQKKPTVTPGRLTQAQLDDAVRRLERNLGPPSPRALVTVNGGTRVRLGDRVAIEATSEIAGRLALIDVNVARNVTPLFPNHYDVGASIGRVAAGQRIAIPGPDYPEAIAFEAREPTGGGLMLAIVAPEEVDLDALVLPGDHLPRGFASVDDPAAYLNRLLAGIEAAIAARTRGGTARADEIRRWGFGLMRYEITP